MDARALSEKRIGTTLREKWVLEELIGVGGMASVYVGRHKIGRREAIKILHAEAMTSEQIRARFEQEARAVNSFKHPGVVEVRDIDTAEDGAPFLVMELLTGETLAERARREPRMSVDEVLAMASATLDVLAAAHERGIIHRDIKPDNLFLTADGVLKVLDFGIARVRANGAARPMATKVGVTLGTFAYMPPEQARGIVAIDARADIYAVGATMFRLLANRAVHDATTEAELVMRVLSDSAPSLASAAPGAPSGVCDVVDRALAYDRDDRYPDAACMRADVDAVARGEPPPHASTAKPIAVRPPSSGLLAFASSSSTPSSRDEPATFVPPAKRPSPSPPDAPPPASSMPTRAGLAPEVSPTKVASVHVPEAARPSMGAPAERPIAHLVPTSSAVGAPFASPGRSRFGHAAVEPVLTPFGELHAFVAARRGAPRSPTLLVVVAVAATAVALALGLGIVLAVRAKSDGATVDEPLVAPSPTFTPSKKPKKD